MGSPCALSLYCATEQIFQKACEIAEQEMQRLEQKYSRYISSSLLSQINQAAGTEQTFNLDEETWYLMQYANTAFEQSEGLFDITSGILRNAWNFKAPQLPEPEILQPILEKIGWHKVALTQSQFRLPIDGMEIDFGGVVKEYAADSLHNLLGNIGIEHGIIDLAGDMKVIGPHPDQSPWIVGIRNPANPDEAAATIPLVSGGLASSGDYARCFELNGKRYSHILNPKTGWPVEGLAAVSVWAEQCVVAGTIATVTMLKGKPHGLEWITELGIPFIAIDQELNITSTIS